MAYVAPVINGELQQGSTTQSTEKTTSSNNGLDKNAFLQLLVAQMKYQDPLEPTSNTEYISQLATFTELEEMQNLVSTSEKDRATSLVGQVVTVEVTGASGSVSYEQGVVDYVRYEGSKTYIGMNGSEYSLDDLYSVEDAEYVEAYSMATAVVTALNKLPTVANLTVDSREAVESITSVYDQMSDYQKSFLTKDQQDLIESYRVKMNELVAQQETANNTSGSEESGSTEGENSAES